MKFIRPLTQKGSVLIAIVLMFPFLALIAIYYLELSVSSLRIAKKDQFQTHAQFATDAGIDLALQEINDDDLWTGTGGEIAFHNDGSTRTTYQVTVADVGSNKEVTAVGRTYSPVTHTTPDSTVTIKVDLRPVTSGNFSLVTGVGGLIMSNSAKILGGNVHVNGEITMSNSSQIGLSTSPVDLNVAHQICPIPASASYPQVCGSGNGEPIDLNNTAHIYGDVKANNQTTTTGITNPGLTASSGVAALPLPPHDRAAQQAAVATTINASAANCSSGTQTWPANLKITGNVVISNSCQVTVMGDVWITGTLEVRNSAKLIVSDSLGTTMPDIMIDGSVAHFRNTAELKSNASSTGFQIVTYRSSPSCSPDCGDLTGTDLYNSRNLVTINLDNSASGPNTIFYARWTRVQVNNSGAIGALVGQTVELRNSGTITFGTSVPGLGTTGWVIDGYRRSF